MNEGHDYRLRGVPQAIWDAARNRALREKRAIRVVIIRALEAYAAGRSES